MKPIQLVLVGVAFLAAIGAGILMMNLNSKPDPETRIVKETIEKPEKEVLVASADIPLGTALSEKNLEWESWPESLLRDAYITREAKPDALEEYAKATARSSFYDGEPIRDSKIVHSDSGYLSAILPAGKRAMALLISAEKSAGGFVLPNDHVDVLMSYKVPDQNLLSTETILQNIRVLAVDQVIEEQDGEKAIVGRTVTLELTAQQTEILTAAKKTAGNSLALALRSIEDAQLGSSDAGQHLLSSGTRKKRGTVRVIKYGNTKEIKPKK